MSHHDNHDNTHAADSMDDGALRDALLCHLYGVLDPAEDRAIRDRLARDPHARALLDEVRGDQDVLARAARLEVGDMTFTPPKVSAWRSPTRWASLAAAATLLLGIGVIASHAHVRNQALARHPVFRVDGPAVVPTGTPAEYVVHTAQLDGAPLGADLSVRVIGADGKTVDTPIVTTTGTGRATFSVKPDLGKPGEVLALSIAATVDGVERTSKTSLMLRDARQVVGRVSTDKPLYRPGDVVRVRSVLLDRFQLTPAGAAPVSISLLDQADTAIDALSLPSVDGVSAAEFVLPAHLSGGRYKVVLSRPGDPSFGKVERAFTVATYRAPRYVWDVDLDKDSYGPGGSGSASVKVERAEGGVPVGAQVESILSVDGVEVARHPVTIGTEGTFRVPFELPAQIERGSAQIAFVVTDGGATDTRAETVPVTLDRLAIEWFPEGGTLVAGIAQRVYFRVEDPQGEPADLAADIVDGNGDVVASLEVDDLGLGQCTLTPKQGAQYSVVARKPSGVTVEGALPEVAQHGVVMRALDEVTPKGAPVAVELAASRAGRHTVVALCRGVLVARAEVELAKGEPTRVELAPQFEVGGVFRLTAFAPDGLPVAERLVSVESPRSIQLTIEPERAAYAPGETVRVDVTARDENGNPTAAVLGVSVLDETVISHADDKDTASMPLHFLLGLEVAELEDVDVYAKAETSARAFDNVLGVQGWRRFAWKDAATFVAKHPDNGSRVLPVVSDEVYGIWLPNVLPALQEASAEVNDWQDGLGRTAVPVGLAALGLLGLLVTVHGARGARFPQTLTGLCVAAVACLLALPRVGPATAITLDSFGQFVGSGGGAGAAPPPVIRIDNLNALVGGAGGGAGRQRIPVNFDDIFFGSAGNPVRFGRGGDNGIFYDLNRGIEIRNAAGIGSRSGAEIDMSGGMGGAWRAESGRYHGLVGGLGGRIPMGYPVLDAGRLGLLYGAGGGAGAGHRTRFLIQADGRDFARNFTTVPTGSWRLFKDDEVEMAQAQAESLALELSMYRKVKGVLSDLPATGGEIEFPNRQINWRKVLRADSLLMTVRGARPAIVRALQFELEGIEEDTGPTGVATDGYFNSRIFLVDTLENGLTGFEDNEYWLRSARNYVLAREFAHRKPATQTAERTDFADLLYWNPVVVCDADGKAQVEFDTSDSLTTFRVAAEAHDARGGLAAEHTTFTNRIPFSVEPKLPVEIAVGDRVFVPITVANAGDAALSGSLTLTAGSGPVQIAASEPKTFEIESAGRTTLRWELVGTAPSAGVDVTVTAQGGANFTDTVRRSVRVAPRGYPVMTSDSGVLKGAAKTVVRLPPEMDRTSLKTTVSLYPSTLATLVDSIAGMLRSPSGCFEQTSSSNYPNVVALAYLQENAIADPELSRTARGYLETGYARLTGYESPGGGFEWWGKDPGHVALTAYGLMQFEDMAQVFPVDAEMLARTRRWLMSKRDGKGGFGGVNKKLHSFGHTSQEIWDTYTTWALSAADADVDLSAEVDLVAARAAKSDDPYLLALAANTLQNRRHPLTSGVVARLARLQAADGSFTGTSNSITASTGQNLAVETTGLAALALLRDADQAERAAQAVEWLVAQRQGHGSFGSTQATVLALKALVAYGKSHPATEGDIEVTLVVNGKEIGRRTASSKSSRAIRFDEELADALQDGENVIELRGPEGAEMPWSVAVDYHTTVPPTDPNCAIDVTTTLARTDVPEGDTVALNVRLSNKRDESVANPLVRVGLPAGLEPRLKQLEELQERGDVAFFELRPREVTLYLRGLHGAETKTIQLDLTAAVPGIYEGPATSAYLYYTNDQITWTAPLRVTISPR